MRDVNVPTPGNGEFMACAVTYSVSKPGVLWQKSSGRLVSSLYSSSLDENDVK